MEAIKAGCHGLHLTVNGMGERAGNAPMASAIAVINDFMPEIEVAVNESSLYKVSKLVSAFTGFGIPANKPIVLKLQESMQMGTVRKTCTSMI